MFHESVEEGKRTLDKGRGRREGGRMFWELITKEALQWAGFAWVVDKER